MADYVTLLGSEDVRRAGQSMASAAADLGRNLQSLEIAVDRLLRGLDERLDRLEALLAERSEVAP